jgi:hypothetical protein
MRALAAAFAAVAGLAAPAVAQQPPPVDGAAIFAGYGDHRGRPGNVLLAFEVVR